MLVQNYWNFKLGNTKQPSNSRYAFVDVNGNNTSAFTFNQSYDSEMRINLQLAENLLMYVGTGDTAPTKNDYNLVSPVANALNNFSVTAISSSNGCVVICTANMTNSTDSDITIKEIGLFKRFFTNNNAYADGMLARTLLTPITLAPNETVGVTYVLTFEEK